MLKPGEKYWKTISLAYIGLKISGFSQALMPFLSQLVVKILVGELSATTLMNSECSSTYGVLSC